MFDNSELPPLIDLNKKRRDYPASSLSQHGITLADPDKRIDEINNQKKTEIKNKIPEIVVDRPDWFDGYEKKLFSGDVDLLKELDKLSTLGLKDLNNHIGGNFDDLPYEIMDTLLVNGTDDPEVAKLLRSKREVYLKNHPDMSRGVPGADQGIITFNGRFINKDKWSTASESEKRSAMVGSTCFHYNSGTPGMDDSPNDRF